MDKTNRPLNRYVANALNVFHCPADHGDADVFVRQDGIAWYIAAFNYTAFGIAKNLNLPRLGLSGTYTAKDLWAGTFSSVTGTNWNVNLGARQAKLFRLMLTVTTSTNLSAALNAGQVTLNWPVDHAGWRLQTQTGLTAGSGHWSDINGSRETNNWIVPLNRATQSVFFRLAWP